MMRILMLTDRLTLGGAETHIYELAWELRRREHTVVLASAGGAYAERMRAEGFAHRRLSFDTRSPLALQGARRALWGLLRAGRFDVVHAHARLPAFLAAPLCRRLGLPFVTTAHWVFSTRGWRRRFSRWGAHTFAVSPDIRAYLQKEYALPRENITVIRNGIDTRRFSPAPHEWGGRLLHISRLDRGRAACAEALIRIAPQLAAGDICRQLTIVGGGDLHKTLAARAEEVNRRLGYPFIEMAGPQTDVLPYLRRADLFLGVSRAALEAMACGLPVILAGDEGYLSLFSKENARQAEVGNLCCRGAPPIEDERLLQDITRLMVARVTGDFGRTYVCRRYSAREMGEAVLSVYRRLAPREKAAFPPVTVCGYYGAHNAGDDAVLLHLEALLRREGFPRPTVLGRRATDTPYPALGRGALLGRSGLLRPGGLFILGGGNLLQNETSDRSLLYYTHLLYRAKQAGCRTLVLGGIGRLDAHGEQIARRAIAASDAFLLRTPQDIATLAALTPDLDKPVRLLPDGALWTRPTKALSHELPGGDLLLLALRVDQGMAYGRAVALSELAAARGISTAIAVMQTGRDEEVAEALAARIKGAVILPPLSAGEWVTFLPRCRLVYATRLHALIFAAVAGVPAITQADGGKISAFADYAAACGGGGLLTCLPATAPAEALFAAAEATLSTPPTKKAADGYLARLRAAGEGFSLARFIEGLA